jgi:hypothetical protein
MDDSGAIEEHVDIARFARDFLDRGRVGDVEHPGLYPIFLQGRERLGVDVGGPHLRAFV